MEMNTMVFVENLADEAGRIRLVFEAEVPSAIWEIMHPYLERAVKAGRVVVRKDGPGLAGEVTKANGRNGATPASDDYTVTDGDASWQIPCRLVSTATKRELDTTMVANLRDSVWEAMEPIIRMGLMVLDAGSDIYHLWDHLESPDVA